MGRCLGGVLGGLSALFLGALAWVAVGMAGFVQVAVALEPGSDCAGGSHTPLLALCLGVTVMVQVPDGVSYARPAPQPDCPASENFGGSCQGWWCLAKDHSQVGTVVLKSRPALTQVPPQK